MKFAKAYLYGDMQYFYRVAGWGGCRSFCLLVKVDIISHWG